MMSPTVFERATSRRSSPICKRGWPTLDTYFEESSARRGCLDATTWRHQTYLMKFKLCSPTCRGRLRASMCLDRTLAASSWTELQKEIYDQASTRSSARNRQWTCCSAYMGLARAQHDTRTFAKSWLMVMKSAQHALDYDMRLYPPAAMKEHLTSLNDALRDCMATLLGRSIPTLAWVQCSLPGRFGGMALRTANPEPLAAATYAAAHDAHWSVLPTLLAQLGRGEAAAHGCENEYAEAARRWLHDAGVAVASGAMIALTKEGAATFDGVTLGVRVPTRHIGARATSPASC